VEKAEPRAGGSGRATSPSRARSGSEKPACERLGAILAERVIKEPVEENPFLPRFYEDRAATPFPRSCFFLLNRYRQQQELLQQDLFQQGTVAITCSTRTGFSPT